VKRKSDESEQDRFYTVKEAAGSFFQGKVSAREIYALFACGELRGFRVGAGKGRILIYGSSLEGYRLAHENTVMHDRLEPDAEAPSPPTGIRERREGLPAIRLQRLPE
jgi:hypothetical protein